MNFNFLFWLFLFGLIVAVFQDLKRREVDDWLNLFLLISSFSFVVFESFFENNPSYLFQAGFALVVMFILMNIFYYGRVFAGGDAKLLLALTVFFIGANFAITLVNIGVFIFFLMISGSIYGLLYSFSFYFKNIKEVNNSIKKNFWRNETKLSLIIGFLLILAGYFNILFLIFGFLFLTFPLLYFFAKGLEKVVLTKVISGKELREGDWLSEEVKVNGKLISPKWEGLSLKEIRTMRFLRKVKIKDGIPFVPAFLIAFLAYVFLKDFFLDLFRLV